MVIKNGPEHSDRTRVLGEFMMSPTDPSAGKSLLSGSLGRSTGGNKRKRCVTQGWKCFNKNVTSYKSKDKTDTLRFLAIIWFICRHMLCFSVHINQGIICTHLDYYISRNSRIVVNVKYQLKMIKVEGRGWIPVAHRRGRCENFWTFLGWDVRLAAKYVI